MQKSSPLIALLIAAALTGIAAAQSPNAEVAYPERDILTPFRECSEIVAPPSKVLAQLQIMRAIGEAEGSAREFDADGREVVDDAQWQAAREIRIQPGSVSGFFVPLHFDAEGAAEGFQQLGGTDRFVDKLRNIKIGGTKIVIAQAGGRKEQQRQKASRSLFADVAG